MNEFDDILFEKTDLDIDTIINDSNPINIHYDQLKQDLNAIKDKSTIQLIDKSNYSLNKLEGNTFNGFHYLIDLDLSYNILISLPRGVFDQLFNLLKINLSHNLISDLEDSIFKNNKQLRTINLSNNLLTEVNGCVFENLLLLRKLDFSYNKIKKLWKIIVHSKSLQEFNLSNNLIKHISQCWFWSIPNLIHLQLNNNRIKDVSDSIFATTTKIKYLNFSNNFIQRLHKRAFVNLHNLNQVDFSNNSLSTLGKCFENKPMLTELNLLNNPINRFWLNEFTISKNICTLKLSIYELQKIRKLKTLEILSNFELHVETDEIFQLHKSVFFWLNESTMRRLYIVIRRGKFNVDYEITSLFNLEFLHIEFQISSADSDMFDMLYHINKMSKLKHLALININKLRIVSTINGSRTILAYLDLTGIDNESVDFLRNNAIMLEYLNLSFSHVESISRDLMCTLPYLKHLIMNNTRITVIVDNLFQYNSNLEVISFQDCQIHTIGENAFQSLKNLDQIDIRGNTHLRITQTLLNGIPKSAIVYYD